MPDRKFTVTLPRRILIAALSVGIGVTFVSASLVDPAYAQALPAATPTQLESSSDPEGEEIPPDGAEEEILEGDPPPQDSGVLLTGASASLVRDLTDPEELGDRFHYNGIVFGDATAYQADTEGALAVGGDLHLGISGGFDIGASYNYIANHHMGQYTNEGNCYPTLLLGGRSLKLGPDTGTPSRNFGVYGGPLVMSHPLYALYETLPYSFEMMPDNSTSGAAKYYDMVLAQQEELDRWFEAQRDNAIWESTLFPKANNTTISIDKLSEYKNFTQNTFSYIEEADAKAVNPYLNTNLVNSSGKVKERVLSITVTSGSDVNFSSRTGNGHLLPISAKWATDYDLVIFNFPNAVNVTMAGDPQIVTSSVGFIKNYPDGLLTAAQKAEKHAICEKVIYNFPVAENVKTDDVLLMGSLLAPNARFEGDGGSVNGQLICQEFVTKSGMELHAFRLSREVSDLFPPEEEGSLTIEKYEYLDGPTGTALEGAEFVLYQVSDRTQYYDGNGGFTTQANASRFRTGEDGTVTITGVPVGQYFLREVTAPYQFAINNTAPLNEYTYFESVVTVTDTREKMTIQRYNEKKKLDVHFSKVDSEMPSRKLAGAKFALFLEGETSTLIRQDIVSGPNGWFVVVGLLPGKYQLREIVPPDGYHIVGDGAFFFEVYLDFVNDIYVRTDESVVGEGSYSLPYQIENEEGAPDNSVLVYKYDGDTTGGRTGLAGARFTLFREVENSPGHWEEVAQNDDPEGPLPIVIETDSSGFYAITRLLPGTYRLLETQAPEGYHLENPCADDSLSLSFPLGYAHEFVINDDDLQLVEAISNSRQAVTLTLEKVDADTPAKALSGAGFRLSRRQEGEWIPYGSGTTGSDGLLSLGELAEGEYLLEETSPPAGYGKLAVDSIRIKVSFEGSAPVITVTAGPEGGEWTVDAGTSPVSASVDDTASPTALSLRVENRANQRNLAIYKVDRDIYQTGTDQDENKVIHIQYLPDAQFRLQRRDDAGVWRDYGDAFESQWIYEEDGEGNPVLGESGEPVPVTDGHGNPMTRAMFYGLTAGSYRLIETRFPDGYRPAEGESPVTLEDNGTGYVMYTFTITKDMADSGGLSEYTINNVSDKPRSDLLIYKKDSYGHPIPSVPFKLWRVAKGAEDWDGEMTLESVLSRFDELEFVKYSTIGGSSSLYTGLDGTLKLTGMEPGVYVLFEHWNESLTGYLKSILYLLSHGTTVAQPDDPSFYYHLTAFRVEAVDESRPELGVRIRWVDRNKIWNGEVLFDNEANNRDDWTPSGGEDSYRSLTVVNKTLEKVAVSFRKTDDGDPATGLPGGLFTLYEKTDFDAPNGELDAYQAVGTATSQADGTVQFQDLGAAWRKADGSLVEEGYRVRETDTFCAEYMILETTPPTGYWGMDGAVYLCLELDPLSKMLDLYLLDQEGHVLQRMPGYREPITDPATGQVVETGEDGKPVTSGTFFTSFVLGDWVNERALSFRFRKVSTFGGEPLEGARFALYACREDHPHSGLAGADGSCWTLLQTGGAEDESLVAFTDLPTGEYRLVETQAPDGYVLPDGQWAIAVDARAETVEITALGTGKGITAPPAFLTARQDADADYWLYNVESTVLPLTGGPGGRAVSLSGALLATVAGLIWWRTRRKQTHCPDEEDRRTPTK